MKKLLVVGGLVLAVFIVAFSVIDLVLVVAMAIPAQAAEIGFCQNNKTGVATFAPSSGKCPKGATLVQINSAGVPGPQGPPGPPGATNGITAAIFGTCTSTGVISGNIPSDIAVSPNYTNNYSVYNIPLSGTAFSSPNVTPHCVVTPVISTSGAIGPPPEPIISVITVFGSCGPIPGFICINLPASPTQSLTVGFSSYNSLTQDWEPFFTDFSFICVQ